MRFTYKGNTPTDLGNNAPIVTGVNADPDGDYRTDAGLPWAINVVNSIPVPTLKPQ